MPVAFKAGCSAPEIEKPNAAVETAVVEEVLEKEATQSMIKVGKPAPDFTLPAYVDGGFATVNLSEYRGKWVLLCFYPGDFTFV